MSNKHYETYIIADGNSEDAAVEEIITKYTNLLTKNKAEIINTERIGRKRLAYPIDKKQNGYYVCIEYNAPANVVAILDKTFRIDENVMRYLTLYLDAKTLKERNDHFTKKAQYLAKLQNEAAAKEAGDAENQTSQTSTETSQAKSGDAVSVS